MFSRSAGHHDDGEGVFAVGEAQSLGAVGDGLFSELEKNQGAGRV